MSGAPDVAGLLQALIRVPCSPERLRGYLTHLDVLAYRDEDETHAAWDARYDTLTEVRATFDRASMSKKARRDLDDAFAEAFGDDWPVIQ